MKDIIFLHGWGQDSSFFRDLSHAFQNNYTCHLLDLPGFGRVPAPTEAWSVSDYAHYVADYCHEQKIEQAIFVGHSFGGKISAVLAVEHSSLVQAIVMIAASGLKRKRSLLFKMKAFSLRLLGKMARLCDTLFKTQFRDIYRNRFGSADYKQAQGVMKDILVKTVSEDISKLAEKINAPTLLVYGEQDTATPSEVGAAYHRLIKTSEYVCLPRQDHYSLLSSGRFQVQNHIDSFLKKIG